MTDSVSKSSSFQWLSFSLGLGLLVWASIQVLIGPRLRADPDLEKRFCSLGMCTTDALTTTAQLQINQAHPERAAILNERVLMREITDPLKWCDLGDALFRSGKRDQARPCYLQAASLGPNIPPVLFRVAVFQLNEGNRSGALGYISRILHLAPAYWTSLFIQYGVLGDDFLRFGLPREAGPAAAYLRFVMASGDAARVQKVWNWVNGASLDDDRLAEEIADFLVKRQMYEAAADAWARHARESGNGYRVTNWLYNADFESDPRGFTFDWRVTPVKRVEVQPDFKSPYSGKRSLRIRFNDADNTLYNYVAQTVVLGRGTWRLEGHLRTEGVSDGDGIAFRIFDKNAPKNLNTRTNQVNGVVPWTAVEKTFQVAVPGLFEIWVERTPSILPDDRMRGTVWLDGFSLRRLSQ